MTIEINGMAHVILTVSRFEVAREFYRKLLPEFGMKPVFDGDKWFYCVGARTAIGIEPCDPALAEERFVQQRVGLHHLCLRARSREDVDRCAALLKEMDATIAPPCMRHAAWHEGTGAGAADRDLVADHERDLAAEDIGHLVAVVLQMELRSRRCTA
jgi:catechol 2,3-dioxygenase-like lactoylglutathione lyase family enzyme